MIPASAPPTTTDAILFLVACVGFACAIGLVVLFLVAFVHDTLMDRRAKHEAPVLRLVPSLEDELDSLVRRPFDQDAA